MNDFGEVMVNSLVLAMECISQTQKTCENFQRTMSIYLGFESTKVKMVLLIFILPTLERV